MGLYDPDDAQGHEVGSAPRWLVRRLNLPHAATAVFVRRANGEILVHQRALTKDLWAGAHDCAAGGVVAAGEDVHEAALRELAEEVGISGVPLRPLLRAWYRDARTWYLGHLYEATWDGEVSFPDAEVVRAWWEPIGVLRQRLADPAWPFVPDTREWLERVSL